MTIAEKYGISQEVVRQMIKDGWLPCSLTKYEEVLAIYEKNITTGMPRLQAITNTSMATKTPERTVYSIIKKFH